MTTRVTVNRLLLQSSLAIAAGISSRKSTMEMLGHVLLSANGKLNVVATDLQIAYSSALACDANGEAEVALSGKALLDAVSSMSGKELHIDIDGVHAELRAGKSRFKLAGLPVKNFPKQMDVSKLVFQPIQMDVLRFLVDHVAFANDSKVNSPSIQGVFVGFGDGTALTSNGHCCASAQQSVKIGTRGVHVPADGLTHLLRAFEHHDEIEISIGAHELYARSNDTLLGIKLLEAQFPHEAVRSFVRTKSAHEATMKRKDLVEAIKRVGLVANTEFGMPIHFFLSSGSLVLRVDEGKGEADDDVACDYAGSPVDFWIAGKLVLKALETMDVEDVRLGYEGKGFVPVYLGPTEDEGYHAMIMPMVR